VANLNTRLNFSMLCHVNTRNSHLCFFSTFALLVLKSEKKQLKGLAEPSNGKDKWTSINSCHVIKKQYLLLKIRVTDLWKTSLIQTLKGQGYCRLDKTRCPYSEVFDGGVVSFGTIEICYYRGGPEGEFRLCNVWSA